MSILAVCLSVAGIVGCIIPAVPGPILSYCGMLCLLTIGNTPSTIILVIFGIITAVVSVLDYIIPILGAKYFKCSKIGACGAAIGTLAGFLFLPYGLILGPFLGAFIAELSVKKSAEDATMGGVGALLGFLTSTFIKMMFCVAITVYVILALF